METKILASTTVGSVALPIDMLYRFIIPIASAVVWFFLKPILIKWQNKRKNKKKDGGQ